VSGRVFQVVITNMVPLLGSLWRGSSNRRLSGHQANHCSPGAHRSGVRRIGSGPIDEIFEAVRVDGPGGSSTLRTAWRSTFEAGSTWPDYCGCS
jgi:hypothetical protein